MKILWTKSANELSKVKLLKTLDFLPQTYGNFLFLMEEEHNFEDNTLNPDDHAL